MRQAGFQTRTVRPGSYMTESLNKWKNMDFNTDFLLIKFILSMYDAKSKAQHIKILQNVTYLYT